MLTTPLEIVNLNGTLRRDCSIFYNDHPLTNKEDDDKRLLEEISLLSTLSSPGSHPTREEKKSSSVYGISRKQCGLINGYTALYVL